MKRSKLLAGAFSTLIVMACAPAYAFAAATIVGGVPVASGYASSASFTSTGADELVLMISGAYVCGSLSVAYDGNPLSYTDCHAGNNLSTPAIYFVTTPVAGSHSFTFGNTYAYAVYEVNGAGVSPLNDKVYTSSSSGSASCSLNSSSNDVLVSFIVGSAGSTPYSYGAPAVNLVVPFTGTPYEYDGSTKAGSGVTDSLSFTQSSIGVDDIMCYSLSGSSVTPPTPGPTSTTTASIDQSEANLFDAFCLFLGSMFMMLWIMKKR